MNDPELKNTIRHDTTKRHIDKYENKGFIHQLVLGRFLDFVGTKLAPYQSSCVLDFGCGEALFWKEMRNRDIEMNDLTGIDLREDALSVAARDFPEHEFIAADILKIEFKDRYDLVVASQVLEHLPSPDRFISKLIDLVKPNGQLLLTVPWEPFFMLSNLVRGRDVLRFGNHPEHVNLWGKRSFKKFVGNYADIVEIKIIFPFIIVLASPLSS